MPGKVNPSVPEMVNQVCFQVMGCDMTIAIACEAGQLELNVMMPVIAWNALHASTILREAMKDARRAARSTASSPTRRARASCSIAARRRRRRSARTSATRRRPRSRKTSVKTGRSIRELVLERGLLDARAARRDPVGRCDDAGRHRGERAGQAGERQAGRAGKAGANESCDRGRARLARSDVLSLPALPGLPARPPSGPVRPREAEGALVPAAGSRPARRRRSRSVAEARTDHGRAEDRRRLGRRRSRRRRRLVHGPARAARRARTASSTPRTSSR